MKLEDVQRIVDNAPKLIKALCTKKREFVLETQKYGKPWYVVKKFSKKEWGSVYDVIMTEIRTRPNPAHRYELWECNIFEDPERRKELLLKIRKRVKAADRKIINKRAVLELARSFNVPDYLAETYLRELKVAPCEKGNDLKAKTYAKVLVIW